MMNKYFDKKFEELKGYINSALMQVLRHTHASYPHVVQHNCSCGGKKDEEISRLKNANSLLTQALCEKYNEGTLIIYDEHTPRIVTVIKNGKTIDMDKAQSLYFHWDRDAFPTVEITQ